MPGVLGEKARWILEQPKDELASSVAERAKAAGFETDANQVHQIRYQERVRQRKGKKATPARKPKQAPPKKKPATRVRAEGRAEGPHTEAERDFAQSAVAIGIPRALEIIEAIQLHWGWFMNNGR